MRCAVCDTPLGQPILADSTGRALTSLCTLLDQPTEVFWCGECGHLQTPPIGDLDAYYSTTYRILLESEEEDQIYAVVDGTAVYRAEHQANTLLSSIEIADGARTLDFGAAKGATMRRVLGDRPDLSVHYFDVSEMYVDHWRQVVPDDSWATFETPEVWSGSFQLVTSFFMLEHVEHPVKVAARILGLLEPGGVVHAIVPNPFTNIGDFIVVDHVNHFTEPSLRRTFELAGFDHVTIDGDSHGGAWVVQARRPRATAPVGAGTVTSTSAEVQRSGTEAAELASFWDGARGRVHAAEQSIDDRAFAIYGAGFYGSYVHASLTRPDRVRAFVDQSPHIQGTQHQGVTVVSPAELPAEVTDVIIGLNPRQARSIVADIVSWHDRSLQFHFL